MLSACYCWQRHRDVMVSRPAWYRDHFFGLGLGLGLTVIGLGLGLGLMKYWSWSHTLWSRLRKVHFQLFSFYAPYCAEISSHWMIRGAIPDSIAVEPTDTSGTPAVAVGDTLGTMQTHSVATSATLCLWRGHCRRRRCHLLLRRRGRRQAIIDPWRWMYLPVCNVHSLIPVRHVALVYTNFTHSQLKCSWDKD